MKILINILLFITQQLHLKMGGKIAVSRDRIILYAPKGRHWFATEKNVESQLQKREAA